MSCFPAGLSSDAVASGSASGGRRDEETQSSPRRPPDAWTSIVGRPRPAPEYGTLHLSAVACRLAHPCFCPDPARVAAGCSTARSAGSPSVATTGPRRPALGATLRADRNTSPRACQGGLRASYTTDALTVCTGRRFDGRARPTRGEGVCRCRTRRVSRFRRVPHLDYVRCSCPVSSLALPSIPPTRHPLAYAVGCARPTPRSQRFEIAGGRALPGERPEAYRACPALERT